ncbi:glycosyltransferase family 1 protein [Salinadaptatus halalkaliphilus]|uniref:Glycosyltransferase family 1 protein n=1 Tax=Salinadaptatus halalkaliphilus TaxID=2419781 RepID=A0A4S3TJN6_9EURY|nr:glycosyltransferase family 4 protein [Salinadaptatus halalkaliphilus]THE63453.1 glycosyltransferase family 1 protein [Salinadaptatus halalkaliphilus]
MKIGLVIYGSLDQRSGGYRYDRKLVEGLEDRGDDVSVISLPRTGVDESGDDRPAVGATEDPCSDIRDRLDRPVDILLQDELCRPTLAAYNRDLERPRRIVTVVHLLDSARPADGCQTVPTRIRDRERRYLESVDGAIATSEFTRKRTTDLASVPTTVAPPAGRHSGPAVSSEAVRERAQTSPLAVTFLGNLIPRKNLSTLLSALARVDREWHLTVVGNRCADPATTRQVRARVDSLGIRDRVSYTGAVDAATLESILDRTHVLAVPSRYESFGMCYLEAMEYGAVPIASTVGGAGEFVADDHNGFLVDPTDLARIVAIVDRLAGDRDRLAALGCRALATADAHPTWADAVTICRRFLRARLETE